MAFSRSSPFEVPIRARCLWALPNGVFPSFPANTAGLWLQTSLSSSSFPNVTHHPPDISRDSLCLSALRHVLSSRHGGVDDSSGGLGTRVNRDKRSELRPEEVLQGTFARTNPPTNLPFGQSKSVGSPRDAASCSDLHVRRCMKSDREPSSSLSFHLFSPPKPTEKN